MNISNIGFFKHKSLALVLRETIGKYEVYFAKTKIDKNQLGLPSTHLQLTDNLSKFSKQSKTLTDLEFGIERTKTALLIIQIFIFIPKFYFSLILEF